MYLYFMIFITALCVGSFLHTLGVRLVDDKLTTIWQKLTVPSQCDHCGKRINPWLLIPVAGFLIAKGRCSHCTTRISFMYPLIELLYALVIVQVYASNGGISFESSLLIIIFSAAAVITAADMRSMLIPDFPLVVLILCGCGLLFLRHSPLDALWGALFLFGVFLLVMLLVPGSFGAGDAKYAAVLGFICGFTGAVIVLESALIVGSLCGILYGVVTRRGLRIRIPFAPFLSAGLYVAVFYTDEILLMYQSLIFNSGNL